LVSKSKLHLPLEEGQSRNQNILSSNIADAMIKDEMKDGRITKVDDA
jgi:hypothetical protein